MKKWNQPEMSVYSVKLDENLAASGADEKQKEFIYYSHGTITFGGGNFWCSSDRTIMDTGIQYNVSGSQKWVHEDYESAISGCLA